jgi:hypothetical protein
MTSFFKKGPPTRDEEFLSEMRKLPCLACGRAAPSEAHHIKTKRCYGDDYWNVLPLCADHHRGSKGWHGGIWSFLKSHPHVVEYMISVGWDIDVSMEVMFHQGNEVQAPTPPTK